MLEVSKTVRRAHARQDQRIRGEDGESVGHPLERVIAADLAGRSRLPVSPMLPGIACILSCA
jgi:hypothetical protein